MEISSKVVAIDGGFDGYLAIAREPRLTKVLLLPEMFGLTDAMLTAVDEFARAGFVTLAPNLFWRAARPGVLAYEGPERQQAWERLQALDLDRAVTDITGAIAWLDAQAPVSVPVIAIGHCIGGRLALRALPHTALAGSVSYYGLGISSQGRELAMLTKPADLHYGLADEHVPQSEVAAVQVALAGNPNVGVHLYPQAGHSFCNPNRPMFDRAAADLVRARTLAFLDAIEANGAISSIV